MEMQPGDLNAGRDWICYNGHERKMAEFADFHIDFVLIEPLNERELDILALFAEQRTNQEIADALFLSLNTVKWYARQIYGKLAVANQAGSGRACKPVGPFSRI